jgi:hypothetical protein
MKQLLVLTLMFTLIFPAYCFASPTNNELLRVEDKAIEIMWMFEDGVIDSEEMHDIIGIYQPGDFCVYAIHYYVGGLMGAVEGMLLGGSWNSSVTLALLLLLGNVHFICNLLGDKDILIPPPEKF